MLETHDLIINLIKNSIYYSDKAAFSLGKVTDFAIIPGSFDDEYYDLLLENDGCDIHFKVYYETEESDCFVTMDLYDELHQSVHVSFSFSSWEDDVLKFQSVLEIVLDHYSFGNWIGAMAEIEHNGFGKFIDINKSQ